MISTNELIEAMEAGKIALELEPLGRMTEGQIMIAVVLALDGAGYVIARKPVVDIAGSTGDE